MLNETTIAGFRASLHGGSIEPGDPGYDAASLTEMEGRKKPAASVATAAPAAAKGKKKGSR